jgi:aspartate kinase
MESMLVSGVTYNKNEARLTISRVPDKPGIAAKIFMPISDAGIVVDMIIQNTRAGELTDLTFTVPRTDYIKAMEILKRIAADIGAEEVSGSENIAKVSIVGVGMRNHSGIASTMFHVLANEGINIMMISTSEIKVSCVIEENYWTSWMFNKKRCKTYGPRRMGKDFLFCFPCALNPVPEPLLYQKR